MKKTPERKPDPAFVGPASVFAAAGVDTMLTERSPSGVVTMKETLRRLDMNLLVVLDALLTEQNVTRASERLGMSQPAVSNALNRLRYLIGDPLFTRGGAGIIPTSRALQLCAPLNESLRLIESALSPPHFDPRTARQTFRLALSDWASTVMLPRFLASQADRAPGIVIETQPKALPTVPDLLDKNRVDFAVGVFMQIPPRLAGETVARERYVCLMRKGHPLAKRELTLATIAGARQVCLQSIPSATAMFDKFLRERQLHREVAAVVNQCAAIPEIVARTELVACLLEGIADAVVRNSPHKLVKRVIPIEPVEIKLVWHNLTRLYAAHEWLRTEIIRACVD
jgi:DNA-binding transcriptional LysR family regulator